jgi:MerR family copper efflux transcriptional regulator
LQEWKTLAARLVRGADRPSPRVLRWALVDEREGLVELIALARAESACCPFFEFRLHLAAAGLSLEIEVPADAVAILDGFAALSPLG